MAVKFKCPNCNKDLGMSEKFAGKQARCPHCEEIFTVPDPSADREVDARCDCGKNVKVWESQLEAGFRCPECRKKITQLALEGGGGGDGGEAIDLDDYSEDDEGYEFVDEEEAPRGGYARRPGAPGGGRPVYCMECGARNNARNFRCVECGARLQRGPRRSIPIGGVRTYLVEAILVTLFCCLPLGIAAIIYAAQVNTHIAAGRFEDAKRSSDIAKTLCWVSVGIWAAFFFIAVLAGIAGA